LSKEPWPQQRKTNHRWVEKCGKIVGEAGSGVSLYRRNLCSAAKQRAKFIAHPSSELQVAMPGKWDEGRGHGRGRGRVREKGVDNLAPRPAAVCVCVMLLMSRDLH